ncbi:MAG: hypothetical protein NVS3B21_30460 [Acidimicrobiales bacterium]
MPTYAWLARFAADFDALTPRQQAAFLVSVRQFVEDLRQGEGFRKGLRVKGVQGAHGIFEMTWAHDGRATFEYGRTISEGEAHIVWRRVGTHAIFARP